MKTAGIAVVVLGAWVGSANADDLVPTSQSSSTSPDSFELLAQAAARSNAGDHLGAIELYERVYRDDADLDLLVAIGGEYRKAGKSDEAIQNLCAYLTIEPNGESVALAASEVVSIDAALGRRLGGDICARADPMLPPIAPPTVHEGPPATNSSLAQPFVGMTSSTSSISLSHRELAGLATGVVGLVGIGIGAYYGMRATDISDQIGAHDPSTPWPTDIKDQEQRGQRAERLQDTFLVTGALVTAAGAYLYVTGHSARIANERISVSPALLQQGGGLAVSGGF